MSNVRDLFNLDRALLPSERQQLVRKGPQPRGYAAPPGTGPEGETCKSCAHLFRNEMSKTYLKCGKAQHKWTGGRASDILARAPACSLWEPAPPKEPAP